MHFHTAHKCSTYGTVVSAFLAVAMSGLLHPVMIVVSSLSFLFSWRWEAPRVELERWELSWTILAVFFFAYQFFSILAGSEIIIGGAHLLVFLTSLKLFNRRQSKDYLHLYILSFLMLTAGTVLNAQITYGIFFLLYIVFTTWSLIIFHIRLELENNSIGTLADSSAIQQSHFRRVIDSNQIVGRKFFIGTAFLSLLLFASAAALFLLVPRVGFGLFFDKSRPGVTMAGFNDGVTLGGHGLIKNDATVVMRVKVPTAYQGRNSQALHWRGVAFDNYNAGQWSRSRSAPITKEFRSYHRRTTVHHVLGLHRPERERKLSESLETSIRQEIYLEPVGYDVLFGASTPLAFELSNGEKNSTISGQNDELRHMHSAGIKYTVFSNPVPPQSSLLKNAGTDIPKGYEVYLQLPKEVPDCLGGESSFANTIRPMCQTRDLARLITQNAHNNFDKAQAIKEWLQTSLEYSLEMKSPEKMEPVEFFLFHRKKGHCEYFSSAMAVLARSVGIPTRNVNGFLGGEWNEYDNYIAVRAGDAHSWVEVYFPEIGWVTFDPTPGGPAGVLGRGDVGVLDKLRRIADSLRFKWFKWVIEYDLYRQIQLFKSIGKSVKGSANTYLNKPFKRAKRWAKANKKGFLVLILFSAFLVGLFSFFQRKRSAVNFFSTQRKKNRKRSSISKSYLTILATLHRKGFHKGKATTPLAFADAMVKKKLPAAESLLELTNIYNEEEYGTAHNRRQEARARELSKIVSRQLAQSKTKQKPPIVT